MSVAGVLAFQKTWDVTSGHALDALRALPDGCIHACCTSPPYFGLRSYRSEAVPWPAVTYCPLAGVPSLTVSAQLASLGLESTLDAYVGHLVLVFREVKRVLHPTGTLWLNLGDTFAAKQLLGVPWRVAFALQADGWILRSEMIWAKKNPLPESVRDRPTRAHEQLFLFAQQPRYFYDAFAVSVAAKCCGRTSYFGTRARRDQEIPPGDPEFRNSTDQWHRQHTQGSRRQMRSVLRLASEPSKIAHFAVMPTQLGRPAILAGTSEQGCCSQCRAPYRRIVVRASVPTERDNGKYAEGEPSCAARRLHAHTYGGQKAGNPSQHPFPAPVTSGWEPGCTCNAGAPVASCVLDPFCGAATVGLVARRYGRRFIGIELNEDYCRLARQRLAGDMPLFDEVD